jgi:ubiquinol oxidase
MLFFIFVLVLLFCAMPCATCTYVYVISSVLHLYETLGWWRKANYLKIHFAESWNEMHHLLIMEELGGSQLWKDRFVAQHAAFFYYWIAVVLYILNPTMAYNINQCVEEHAYTTYDTFLRNHEDELKTFVAPDIAIQYYRDGDLYMFDEAQTNTNGGPRRPIINNLYDVFVAIRDDELDHVKTMAALQQDIELVSSNGEKCKAESEEVFGTA